MNRGVVLVYVDHTVRFHRNTGIQRCVRSLSRALMELGQQLQPVIWNRKQACLESASLADRCHLARWGGPEIEHWNDIISTHAGQSFLTPGQATWLIIPELVSGPHNPTSDRLLCEGARLKVHVAWLFHDDLPLRWSHLYGARAASTASAHATYMAGLADFDLVLANSRTSAAQLLEFWGNNQIIPKARLHTVPLATEMLTTMRLAPPNSQANIVLCVGSLEPRKNHRALLKSFIWLVTNSLWPKSFTLVLVGWGSDDSVVSMVNRVMNMGLPLVWEQDADDVRLLALYRQTRFSVYPSLEEGFGLPVAESLWHRRPCLCSNAGALGELSADGGCQIVDTSDWFDLALGLKRLIGDPSLQHKLQIEINQRRPRQWRDVAMDWLKYLDIAPSQR